MERRVGKAPSETPSFQPYWGKPAVRNDRGDRGDVGIIRSPVRASILPDFGVLVLSVAAGTAGGIARDLLIGAVPPAAISDWRYLAVSQLAGIITFYWFSGIGRLRRPVLVFDGAGLALFAVSGTQKALAFGLDPVMAALLGMLTGIGGGTTRDWVL